MREGHKSWDGVYKCDFILINCDKDKLVFIELKGEDVKHALKQIESTYHIIRRKNILHFKEFKLGGVVVSTRNHPQIFQTAEYRNLKKIYKENLTIKNREYTYN